MRQGRRAPALAATVPSWSQLFKETQLVSRRTSLEKQCEGPLHTVHLLSPSHLLSLSGQGLPPNH